MHPRMAMNVAQHRIVNLLKNIIRFFVIMCLDVFNVWPKTILLPGGPETPKYWVPLIECFFHELWIALNSNSRFITQLDQVYNFLNFSHLICKTWELESLACREVNKEILWKPYCRQRSTGISPRTKILCKCTAGRKRLVCQ